MHEDLGDSAIEKKPAKQQSKKEEAPATPAPLFSLVPEGRSIVLVPEDLKERRKALEALEDAIKSTPGSRNPRILTSLNVRKLDESFVIYTAVVKRDRLAISPPVKTAQHAVELQEDGLGDDVDFGLQATVRTLDLPGIINAVQKGVGPSWRVANHSGSIRLLNT